MEPVSYLQVAEGPEGNQDVTSPKEETRSSVLLRCPVNNGKLHADRRPEWGRCGPRDSAGDGGEGSLENCRSSGMAHRFCDRKLVTNTGQLVVLAEV